MTASEPTNRTRAAALLPAGLRDVLPPAAAGEARTMDRLMMRFARNGYEQVTPPLVEFEDSFLGGMGAAMTRETFRLMDPVSQRMMAVRSDITPQIARVATSRLAAAERPLRLSYGGTVLRVTAGQLRPDRQFRQAGIELIGTADLAADAEVIRVAVESLAALGVADITVDMNMPRLVPEIVRAMEIGPDRTDQLESALDRKDAARVADLAGAEWADLLMALIRAGGPVETALPALRKLAMPPGVNGAIDDLAGVVERLDGLDATITVDAVEHRGFEYHTGTSFSLFARGARNEIGRGGRYLAGGTARDDGEPATGITLFLDVVQHVAPRERPARRLYLPAGTGAVDRRRLQDEGWATVSGLASVADAAAEARRLSCDAALVDGVAHDLSRQDITGKT